MKQYLILVVAILFSSLLTATLIRGDAGNSPKLSESAYQRILRTGTIRCGYWAWPPFLVVDPNTKNMIGPTYDYMQAVGKTLGLKIEWVMEIGVGELVAALDSNRFDVMCMTVWPEEARLKNTLISKPVFYSAVYPTVRANDNRFDNDLDTLSKPSVHVAVIDADTSLSIAQNKLPNAKLVSLPQMSDSSQLMQSLIANKADVTFLDEGVVYDFNKTNNSKLKLITAFGPAKVFPEVFMVKRGEMELKTLLDAAIDTLESDSYAAKILKPYRISSYPPHTPYDLNYKKNAR